MRLPLAFTLTFLLFSQINLFSQKLVDEFTPSLIKPPYISALDIQSDGKILVGGRDLSFANGEPIGQFARINVDGTLDKTFNPEHFMRDNITSVVAGDTSIILLLNDQGLKLVNFQGEAYTNFNADKISYIAGVLFDSKSYLIYGYENSRSGYVIRRLGTDGSFVNTFNEGVADNEINKVILLSDNRLLALGKFSTYSNISKSGIVKLNTDGSIDESFVATCDDNAVINAVELSDGKLLISGDFNSFNGINTSGGLIRLNADGSTDNSFNLGAVSGQISSVTQIVEQNDGKLIVGGTSKTLSVGYTIMRLNADGTKDNTFTQSDIMGLEGFGQFHIGETNDKIIIGGYFENVQDVVSPGFAALNQDGTVDSNVKPWLGSVAYIYDALTQSDGKMVLFGDFTRVNGTDCRFVARLNNDGTLDKSFNLDPSINPTRQRSIAIQSDGKLIIGGSFQSGYSKRLNTDGSLDHSFQSAFFSQTENILVDANDNITVQSDKEIVQLNSDGSIKTGFSTSGQFVDNFNIETITPDLSGGFIVGGGIIGENGFVYRIDNTGTVISGYNADGLSANINAIARISDTQIAAGGYFTISNGPWTENALYMIDNSGNVSDSTSTVITSGATDNTSLYTQISVLNEKELLISGVFSEVNGNSVVGVSDIKLNDGTNGGLSFNIEGYQVSKFLISDDAESAYIFGPFSSVDSQVRFGAAKITLTNAIPVITGSSVLETPEDTPIEITLDDFTVTDLDNTYPDDFSLILLEGDHYTLSENMVTPELNFNGELSITAKVNDGKDDSNEFTLIVNVTPVNDIPVITGVTSSYTTPEETALTLSINDLIIDDPDNSFPDDFQLIITQGTDNYSIMGDQIIPGQDFNGTLTIPVIVNDGTDDSEPFNLSIEVTPVNDPPVIKGITTSLSTTQGTPVTIPINDLTVEDPDNQFPDDFTLSIADGENYLASGDQVTPSQGFVGSLDVIVTVNDGTDDSQPYTLTINVTAILETPSVDELVKVYPNPIKDQLNLNLRSNSKSYDVSIYSLNGKLMYFKNGWNNRDHSIDVSPFPKGIYILTLKDSKNSVSKRLIKE